MSGWTCASVASALCLCAALARAQPNASLDGLLSVQPDAEGCITAPALRARVQHWLKRPPQAGLKLSVRAGAQPISFVVEREGRVVAERTFERLPESCADRLNALALAVSLTIEGAAEIPDGAHVGDDASRASAALELPSQASEPAKTDSSKSVASAEPAPTSAPVVEAKSTPPAASAAAPAQSSQAPARDRPAKSPRSSGSGGAPGLRLEAGASYLLGALPDASGMISAGIEWPLARRFELRFAGVIVPASQTAFNGGSAQTQVYGARVLACVPWLAANLSVEGCAGGVGGAARATGEKFGSNSSATMAWLGALARLGVRFPADSSVSVRLAVDALGNLVRPKLQVAGPRPQAVSGSAFGAAGSLELLFALP